MAHARSLHPLKDRARRSRAIRSMKDFVCPSSTMYVQIIPVTRGAKTPQKEGPAMIRSQLAEFMRRMQRNSVAIIPAAREATRSNDTHYRFRQDSDFFYLTGFEEPQSIAVIKSNHYTLFVRPRDPEREIWDGRRAGVDGAKSEFGADESFPISEFDEKLQDA